MVSILSFYPIVDWFFSAVVINVMATVFLGWSFTYAFFCIMVWIQTVSHQPMLCAQVGHYFGRLLKHSKLRISLKGRGHLAHPFEGYAHAPQLLTLLLYVYCKVA